MKRIYTLLVIALFSIAPVLAQEIEDEVCDTAWVVAPDDFDLDALNDSLQAVFEEELKCALDGDTEAMVNVGWFYETGRGIERDDEQAVYWYTKASDAGDPYGLYYLACHYINSGEEDEEVCYNMIKQAAEAHVIEAQIQYGKYLREQGSYHEAIKWWEMAAEEGDSYAMTLIGLAYYNGLVEKDYDRAFEIFTQAANEGSVPAMYYLGECYFYGRGVEEDREIAAEWYQYGAEEDEPNSCAALGYCYEMGEGVPQDYEEAAKWYHEANNNVYAMYALAWLFDNGLGVSQDSEEADSLRQECENNEEAAGTWLTYDYGNGHEICDVVEHSRRLIQLANDGDERAIATLAFNYINGIGLKQDITRGMEMLEAAAEADNYRAMAYLASILKNGSFDIPKDIDRAVSLLTEASDAGDEVAQYVLGDCYENGIGVEKNIEKARELYRLSAENGNNRAKSQINVLNNNNKSK